MHRLVSLASALALLLAVVACGGTDEASAPLGSNNSSNSNGSSNGTITDAGSDPTDADTTGGGDDTSTTADDTSTTGGGDDDTSSTTDTGDPPQDSGTAQDTEEMDARVYDPGGMCDPYAQDCPESENGEPQQCVPIQGEPRCIPRNAQQVAAEQPCTGGDCAAGLTCINWGGDRGQVCTQMCDRNTREGCADNFSCSAWVQSNDNIGLCLPRPVLCDIYAQDCPEPDQGCTFGRDPDTNDPIFVCATAGPQANGQLCSDGNGRCQAGLICIRTEGDAATCSRVCQNDNDCLGGQTCSGRSTTWDATFCR
ncbi:MAG: hypothetical protein AAFX99_32700 [Myxococcota bacterium]